MIGWLRYYTESFTGLLLATLRWYSPDLTKWISRDPFEYEGGDNLYKYVDGRPLDKSDFKGLLANKPARFPNNQSFEKVICKSEDKLCNSMRELANKNHYKEK